MLDIGKMPLRVADMLGAAQCVTPESTVHVDYELSMTVAFNPL